MKRPFTWVAVGFLVLVGLAHGLRVVLGASIVIGGKELPMWPSAPAAAFCLALAALVAREARKG